MTHRDPITGRFSAKPLPPSAPEEPDPLAFPTQKAPRLRLRVFDQRWPWRRTWEEVIDDAIASGNGRFDRVTGHKSLVVPAMIQRDPPGAMRQPFVDCTDWAVAERARRDRRG